LLTEETLDASFIPNERVTLPKKTIPIFEGAITSLLIILTCFNSDANPEVHPFLPGIEYRKGGAVFPADAWVASD
jgi:hypothetical protein